MKEFVGLRGKKTCRCLKDSSHKDKKAMGAKS